VKIRVRVGPSRIAGQGLFTEQDIQPAVCLDVTSLAVYSYGYNSGKIVGIVSGSPF
jgi:hypothetical protein